MSIGYLAAFGGGVVSFASPCVMPIVPAYLSVITGLDITTAGSGDRHALTRIARDTGLFVAGFTVVFVLLGLTASAAGQAVLRHHELLTRITGAALIAFGLFLAGGLVLRIPALYSEARFQVVPSRWGPLAAPVAGAAFGFGWTPCIGPVLGSVLTVAATRGNTVQGAGLLLAYALGLGIPFLVAGLAFGRLAGAFAWVRRRVRGITIVAATFMVGFGILLTLNRLTWVTTGLETALRHIGLGRLVTLG